MRQLQPTPSLRSWHNQFLANLEPLPVHFRIRFAQSFDADPGHGRDSRQRVSHPRYVSACFWFRFARKAPAWFFRSTRNHSFVLQDNGVRSFIDTADLQQTPLRNQNRVRQLYP